MVPSSEESRVKLLAYSLTSFYNVASFSLVRFHDAYLVYPTFGLHASLDMSVGLNVGALSL